jgi:hypothetical protein
VTGVDAEVLDDSTAIQRCCEEDDLKGELVQMVSVLWQKKVGCQVHLPWPSVASA